MSARRGRVESDAIRGIRGKLSRAARQFQSIERSIDSYWERNPMRVTGEFNPNFTQYVSRLVIDEHPPVDWSVRLGEAVYNIRTALDHVANHLTVSQTGYEIDTTVFPIFSDARKFQAEGRTAIRGVSEDARALIESAQPFQAPNPRATVLWYVHQVWNQDKHGNVRMMPAIADDIYTLTVDPPDVTARVTIREGMKEDQAILATVDLAKPMPDVEVVLEPTLYVANQFSWNLEPDITSVHRRVVAETTALIERMLELVA